MRDFLLSLKIRVKLLAAFGSILLLSVLLIFFSISSINRILSFKEINEEVDGLKLNLETLELSAREFLHEGYKEEVFLKNDSSKALGMFHDGYARSREIILRIEGAALSAEDRQLTLGLLATLDSLAASFDQLVTLLKHRGFRDFGSEGALRTAIHKVENSGFNIDKVAMLTLRRHEKDFFLRKDLRYLDEFNARITDFRKQLADDPALADLIPFVDNYKAEFNNVVTIEKKIGLKNQDGIRGKLQTYFAQIRPRLDTFRARSKDNNEREIFRTRVILSILFIVQIAAGLIMAFVYASLLTRAIKDIRDATQSLAAGVFPPKLAIKTTEEIGQTKMAFNQFVDRLKAATTFAQQMGAGAQEIQYDARYTDDVLAQSLVQARQKLTDAEARQSKINWSNEAVARFNDILQNEQDSIEVLGDKILGLLVKVLQANQAALYLVVRSKEDQFVERIATYAYEKKKFESHRLDIGDGLIGQCALEGSTIYLKEIPRDYVRITSGLGEATPRNVLIVPLKVRAAVMGVIELASFRLFEPYQVEFIERIAENIATLLSNKQTAEDTKRLLAESQRRANELIQQEEEMRQNSEELQATQEEMARQRKVMEDRIRELERKVEAFEMAAMENRYN